MLQTFHIIKYRSIIGNNGNARRASCVRALNPLSLVIQYAIHNCVKQRQRSGFDSGAITTFKCCMRVIIVLRTFIRTFPSRSKEQWCYWSLCNRRVMFLTQNIVYSKSFSFAGGYMLYKYSVNTETVNAEW